MDKPLSKLRKLSKTKSERFYFKMTRQLEAEENFIKAYSVNWIGSYNYYRTGYVDLGTVKHELLKEASIAYGINFIPEKTFLVENANR